MSDGRDFNDPKYKAWRKKVYARDRYRCRMPGCPGGDKRLNAHHIKKWASYPGLRFVVSNGVTLCRTCHERIRGLEEDYESLFSAIVRDDRGDSDALVSLLLLRYGEQKENR